MNATPEGKLSEADPILAGIIAVIPRPEIKSTKDVFFDLMSCILEQQIHYRSTKRIFQNMLQRADLTTLNIDNFPVFEERALGSVRLAASKFETLEQTLTFFSKNKVDWHALSDSEVGEKLSTIKGIGQWTIDMILLYTLERPNVFPADDFHVKELMTRLYGLDPKSKLKAQMLEVAHRWGEHKSLAVKYLLDWKKYQKSL